MANIHQSIDSLVGNTPVVEMCRLARDAGIKAHLIAKLEYFNPAGSAKDRVALSIVNEAVQAGKLTEDSVIVEPTSGNTGIGIAAICAARGYRVVIVMPDSMSVERRRLMTAYGAELVLTPGKGGMAAAIAEAERIVDATPGALLAGQFTNPANPAAHYATTGPELWRDTDEQIDALVCGIGTGGTISGAGRYLKEQNPSIQIIGVEPDDSPVLSGGKAGPHPLQGIGAGFVPDTLSVDLLDEVIRVQSPDAMECARAAARREGILVGVSSGAALWAAMQVAARPEMEDKTVAVVLPDGGERYLSGDLFQ